MYLESLEKILGKESPYRLKQVKNALFRNLAENWSEVNVLPLPLRQALAKECPIGIRAETFVSKDGRTIKALIELEDGLKAEAVLMRHEGKRNSVCVSSQIGCPLKCLFCVTGKMGFKRNLEAFEIVEQVLFYARYLKKLGDKVTSVVFMGMGEPFLNYKNVLGAVKMLNDKDGINLGARNISISTAGITEGIKNLSEEGLQINLAVSFHAPNDELRSKIMPIGKKYPIKKILSAIDDYTRKTKRRVMFEYVMIKGVNDSDECAREMAKLMKRPLCFINLISYNPSGDFQPSSPGRIKKFKDILEERGVTVTQRYRFGQDIEAACGQLA